MIDSSDGVNYDWPKGWPPLGSLPGDERFYVVTEVIDDKGATTGDWMEGGTFDEACDSMADDAADFASAGFQAWLCCVTLIYGGGQYVRTAAVANKGFRWGGQGGAADPSTIHRSIGQAAGHYLRALTESRKGTADVSADQVMYDDDEDTQLAPDDRFDSERDANGPVRTTTPPEEPPSPNTGSNDPSS